MAVVQGLRIYRPDGSIRLDLTDRVARVIGIYDSASGPVPGQNGWETVPEAPITGDMWGICVPVGNLESGDLYGGGIPVVRTDVTKPGQIWTHGTVNGSRFILIYGVY